MSTRPYKTTGCFRFAIFLLLFAPLAYLGASYYNGQDGLGNLKKMFSKVVSVFSGVTTTTSSTKSDGNASSSNTNVAVQNAEISDLKSAVERKDKEINTLINENLELKMKLKECEGNTPPK